jgi:hypothetical protein
MNYILWIDDIRTPTFPFSTSLVFWAKDVEQAKFYVACHGFPAFMILDHDLGESTVMQFLEWLKDLHPVPDRLIAYDVISANPVGRARISAFMDSWRHEVVGKVPTDR